MGSLFTFVVFIVIVVAKVVSASNKAKQKAQKYNTQSATADGVSKRLQQDDLDRKTANTVTAKRVSQNAKPSRRLQQDDWQRKLEKGIGDLLGVPLAAPTVAKPAAPPQIDNTQTTLERSMEGYSVAEDYQSSYGGEDPGCEECAPEDEPQIKPVLPKPETAMPQPVQAAPPAQPLPPAAASLKLDRQSLVNGVIWHEILSPPRAFNPNRRKF